MRISNFKRQVRRAGYIAVGTAVLAGTSATLAPLAHAANGLRKIVLRANGL